MEHFRKTLITPLILCLLLGFTIACSKRPSDETIAKDIQDKVASDPATSDSSVTVTAKDGKVIVTGQVKDQAAHQRIEQIANEEPGATSFDDQTSVGPGHLASREQAPPPAPVEKPKPKPIVVPAGTTLTVKLSQGLSSKNSQAGQSFEARVVQPVTISGKTAIPAGCSTTGTVVAAKAKGKVKGEGQLSVSLLSITIEGKTYPLRTNTFDSTVKGKGKRTAATTGGGAAGGALIGGIAGGGKGAAIGAAVGAGAGFLGGAMTGNKQVELPPETALSFTLADSLTLPPRPE